MSSFERDMIHTELAGIKDNLTRLYDDAKRVNADTKQKYDILDSMNRRDPLLRDARAGLFQEIQGLKLARDDVQEGINALKRQRDAVIYKLDFLKRRY